VDEYLPIGTLVNDNEEVETGVGDRLWEDISNCM
jgi:hypothetical protein